jgi:hypothetical protein
VQVLREFRDTYLNRNRAGRALVGLYYQLSPEAARTIARSECARTVVRAGLTPLIWWAWLMLASPVAGASVSFIALGLTVWLCLVITRVLGILRH